MLIRNGGDLIGNVVEVSSDEEMFLEDEEEAVKVGGGGGHARGGAFDCGRGREKKDKVGGYQKPDSQVAPVEKALGRQKGEETENALQALQVNRNGNKTGERDESKALREEVCGASNTSNAMEIDDALNSEQTNKPPEDAGAAVMLEQDQLGGAQHAAQESPNTPVPQVLTLLASLVHKYKY